MGALFAIGDAVALLWNWIGINAAILIAIAALIYTARQFGVARRHNEISVSPKLTWTRNWKCQVDQTTGLHTCQFALRLANMGLGGAEVTQYVVREGDTELRFDSDAMATRIAEFIGGLSGSVLGREIWETPAPFWISKDGSISVLTVTFQVPNAVHFAIAMRFLKTISVQAQCVSLYGHSSGTDSRT